MLELAAVREAVLIAVLDVVGQTVGVRVAREGERARLVLEPDREVVAVDVVARDGAKQHGQVGVVERGVADRGTQGRHVARIGRLGAERRLAEDGALEQEHVLRVDLLVERDVALPRPEDGGRSEAQDRQESASSEGRHG